MRLSFPLVALRSFTQTTRSTILFNGLIFKMIGNKQDSTRNSNNFNFLRLLLALLVLLSHSSELIDGDRHREILTRIFHTISFGELAVSSFFLISGYLIIKSWEHNPQIFIFLKKRILRIYPAFIIASIICAFIVGPLGASFTDYFTQFNILHHINFLYYLKELFLLRIPDVPPIFVGQPYPSVNASMWTIIYEFRCYLIVILLGILGIIKQRKQFLILFILVLFVSLFSNLLDKINLSGLLYTLLGNLTYLIRFLSFFFAGGCFYLFRDYIYNNNMLIFFSLPIIILSLFEINFLRFILPTFGAYILFWFAFSPIPILYRFGRLSDISYGVYLYGWPIQKLLCWNNPQISPERLFLLSFCLSILCGFLSWHLVEKHFIQPRQDRNILNSDYKES